MGIYVNLITKSSSPLLQDLSQLSPAARVAFTFSIELNAVTLQSTSADKYVR
jgi:hypothetical protein